MPIYNLLDFHAHGDAVTLDTRAIQSAIDMCHANGGGTVLVPAGKTFLSGALQLKANVNLHLEANATLLASTDYADYPAALQVESVTEGIVDEGDEFPHRAFIIAYRADNLSITGSGTIDGHGRALVAEDLGYIYRMRGADQYRERPFTLFLIGCNNLTLRDITVKDGAFWTVRLTGCEDVLIHGLRIRNDLKMPNNDGIDLDRCRHVRVSDCHIVCGDDAICLKACRATGAFGACEHITVTGCTVMSTSSALKIGNECRAPIRNVIFDACVIQSSHRGLSIHLSESGDVENVLFSNMLIETRLFNSAWWGRGEPIYVNATPWDDKRGIGHIRNVRFTNIMAHSENGVIIHGWNAGLVENILLENVRLELDQWSEIPGGEHDLRPCPGEGLYQHPTNGFFIKNVTNVTMRQCQLVWGKNKPDYFGEPIETIAAINFVNKDFLVS